MTLITKEHIEYYGDKKARLVLKGQWFYDSTVPMPVQVFAINYDYYFEMDKAEGFLDPDERPELNKDGEQYLIAWHDNKFFSFAAATNYGGLTIEDAKASAENVVKQKINWVEQIDF